MTQWQGRLSWDSPPKKKKEEISKEAEKELKAEVKYRIWIYVNSCVSVVSSTRFINTSFWCRGWMKNKERFKNVGDLVMKITHMFTIVFNMFMFGSIWNRLGNNIWLAKLNILWLNVHLTYLYLHNICKHSKPHTSIHIIIIIIVQFLYSAYVFT